MNNNFVTASVFLNKFFCSDDNQFGSGGVLCAAIDKTDNCKFYYTYSILPDGGYIFVAEKDKRKHTEYSDADENSIYFFVGCKPAYSLLIILWCILLFLLIGLILLCCWKCCVYVIEKQEERAYLAGVPGLVPLLPVIGASKLYL